MGKWCRNDAEMMPIEWGFHKWFHNTVANMETESDDDNLHCIDMYWLYWASKTTYRQGFWFHCSILKLWQSIDDVRFKNNPSELGCSLFLENLVLLVQPIMDMFDSHGFAEGKHNWKPMGFVNPGVFCMFFLNSTISWENKSKLKSHSTTYDPLTN